MLTIAALLAADKLPTPVTCGTCPVSMQCAIGRGGTGYTCHRCHATAVQLGLEDVVIIDCTRHRFSTHAATHDASNLPCEMCTGYVATSPHRSYVPTVHALVSLGERRAKMRRLLAKGTP